MSLIIILYIIVIERGLKENFKEASVNVVDCPNLTSSPWQLAAPGKEVNRSLQRGNALKRVKGLK